VAGIAVGGVIIKGVHPAAARAVQTITSIEKRKTTKGVRKKRNEA